MELYDSMLDVWLGYASICKRVAGHTHWKIFLWRRGIPCCFGPFVFLLMETIFSFNFWKAASIVSLGEAKNGFIFGVKLWLRVWSQNLSFFFGVCGRLFPLGLCWKRQDARVYGSVTHEESYMLRCLKNGTL